MAEDALIAGAAAPAKGRLIGAAATLDAVWVVVAACAVVTSGFFALIDLPTATLRTGEAPLRVFVFALPVVAVVVAVVGAARASTTMVALATGVLVPGAALAGSLALLLFFDSGSAFANTGVTVSIGAALVVLITVIRWFVYHPVSLLSNELRPQHLHTRLLGALGVALTLLVLVLGLDADKSLAWAGQTMALLLVPLVVIGSAIVRSVSAASLAAGAAAAQVFAVIVAKFEQSSIAFDSDLLLRTGIPGLVLLVAMVGVVALSVRGALADDDTALPAADDDAAWRWSVDD